MIIEANAKSGLKRVIVMSTSAISQLIIPSLVFFSFLSVPSGSSFGLTI